MKTDRELMELAAKAAGYGTNHQWNVERAKRGIDSLCIVDVSTAWNPITNDGHAFSLAVTLNLNIEYDACPEGIIVFVYGNCDGSPEAVTETFEKDGGRAATRRAIVRAAAEIGKTK